MNSWEINSLVPPPQFAYVISNLNSYQTIDIYYVTHTFFNNALFIYPYQKTYFIEKSQANNDKIEWAG